MSTTGFDDSGVFVWPAAAWVSSYLDREGSAGTLRDLLEADPVLDHDAFHRRVAPAAGGLGDLYVYRSGGLEFASRADHTTGTGLSYRFRITPGTAEELVRLA